MRLIVWIMTATTILTLVTAVLILEHYAGEITEDCDTSIHAL